MGASFCSDLAPGPTDAGGFNSLPSWVDLKKSLKSIAVTDNHVWGIDVGGTLWYLDNFKASLDWLKVATQVSAISATHELICQLSAMSHLLCAAAQRPPSAATATGLHPLPWTDAGATTYRQIALSAGAQLWAVDGANNLVRITDYRNLAATATYVAAGVQEVAADRSGLLCVTDSNSNVVCSNWAVVPPNATDYGLYHSLSTWTRTSATLGNIAVADGKLFGTDASGRVWLLPDYSNPSSWMPIAYGGVGDKVAAAPVPSVFTASTFATDEVAVLLFMGQSNATGVNAIPNRFIAPASPNVWGVTNEGWTFLPYNYNGQSPAFTKPISSILTTSWSQWHIASSYPDMNLGLNNGAAGNAANFAAFQWQAMINAGMKLPDLYIVHIAWGSQGVDPNDIISGVKINRWQPLLTGAELPTDALAPFARRIVYKALDNLLRSGKKPRLIGLQWNQWEAEAGVSDATVAAAPTNYTNLFSSFYNAIGIHYPIQFAKPLSTAYGATRLAQMQAVFANLVKSSPADFSVIDVSQVIANPFSGGVLGGGDGFLHYNLDAHQWFASQAIGVCLINAACGPRITALPATPTN